MNYFRKALPFSPSQILSDQTLRHDKHPTKPVPAGPVCCLTFSGASGKVYKYYEQEKNLKFIILIAEKIQATQALFLRNVSPELDKIKFLIQKYNLGIDASQTQNPNIFVILPFQEPFLIVYEKAVKPVLTDLGCVVNKADDVKTVDSIISIIVTQITQAKFLVADVTHKNPNVFYEIGYAHALGKKVILLSQSAEDLPFDVRHWRHIIYDSDSLNTLKKELREVASNLLLLKP